MKEDTRGSDVRDIKGEENFKKGVITVKKSLRGHAYGIWVLGLSADHGESW